MQEQGREQFLPGKTILLLEGKTVPGCFFGNDASAS
jgi:hypothetical protein